MSRGFNARVLRHADVVWEDRMAVQGLRSRNLSFSEELLLVKMV